MGNLAKHGQSQTAQGEGILYLDNIIYHPWNACRRGRRHRMCLCAEGCAVLGGLFRGNRFRFLVVDYVEVHDPEEDVNEPGPGIYEVISDKQYKVCYSHQYVTG